MDQIKRKLAIIDKQLAGEVFYKRIIGTAPLVFCAIGLMAGIVVQEVLLGSRVAGDGARFVWFWVILLAFCFGTAVLLFIFQTAGRGKSHGPVLFGCCALVGFACLGGVRLISFGQAEANDIRSFVTDEPTLATIRGVIVSEPYINRNRDWKFAPFKPGDPVSSFYLRLTEVKTIAGWADAGGIIRVQVDEPVLDLKAGDCIQAYCWLERFKPTTNPGQFDIARHMGRRNVFLAASVKTRDGIELTESPAGAVLTKIKRKIRATVAYALLGAMPSEDPSRGLLQALLLGYRGDIDSQTYRAFRRTNLLHFISLSGMHLGILIGIIWWLCKTAGLMKPGRGIVCIIAIAVFLLVVPPRAPTLRAAIIGWVFCASCLFRRRHNPLNTLSLAAIILLLIQPTQLFAAGWQLSFATVLGILLFEERIEYIVGETFDRLFSEVEYRQFWTAGRLMRKFAAMTVPLFSVGAAAWLGGAGILLCHFHTIAPLACIWTVLVFPLVAVILTLGFLKIILFFLLPTLSAALGVVVTGFSEALIRAVKLLAHLDFSQILVGRVPLWPVLLYYGFIFFAAFVHFRRPRAKNVICTMAVLLAVFSIGAAKWRRTHRSDLIVTCLDVSHGQAVFVELPGKANILFDAGSLHMSDIGRRVVLPFLSRRGISRIDALLISHNDIDHVNGIPEIVEGCEVKAVYANDAFFDEKDQWGAAKLLNELLSSNGLDIKRLDGDLDLGGAAQVKMLWPVEQISTMGLDDNDKSLVLLIEFAGRKILLCSDIEKFAQKELLSLYPALKAEIVVAPHHGSITTAEPEFLNRVGPGIVICSCGRREYQRQQKIESRSAARRFYTPEHGAVTIRIDRTGEMSTRTGASANGKWRTYRIE